MARLARVGAREDADPHVVIVGAGGSRAACPDGDRNGRALPLLKDLPDIADLRPLLEEAGIDPARLSDFEALYDDLATSGQHKELVTEIEARTTDYFADVQIPDVATVYDYLLLSLRPKDLIATFNWDPLLAQAFRRHEGLISMPKLAFLHGNVAAGFCEEHRRVGWHDDRCATCGEPFSASPLLFPVKDKNYTSNASIRSQWALLEEHLERAYFVTIFGYSAPVTDAAAREIMLKVWSENSARDVAEIEIINTRPRDELREVWSDFIVRSHYITTNTVMKAYTSWHPRRSCDALFAATMLCEPWEDDWLPESSDPAELRRWVDPLWKEELELCETGKRFSGRSCRDWHGREPGLKE